jgi:probable nitrogen fixation protein
MTQTEIAPNPTQDAAPGHPFNATLAALVRSEIPGMDEPLGPFLLGKEARRAIPIIGDPDPETLRRVELFYRAVGHLVQERSGLAVAHLMKMSHEGFGRVILSAGKLVVFAKSLRDVHRFGFDGFDALAREGEKAVAQALATIAAYPDPARA